MHCVRTVKHCVCVCETVCDSDTYIKISNSAHTYSLPNASAYSNGSV